MMERPDKQFARVVQDLENTGCRFALVGALALGVRATPRFTKDIDFAVAVSGNATMHDVLRPLLASKRYELLKSPEGRLPASDTQPMVALQPVGEHRFVVDLLFNLCGIEDKVVQRATPIEVFPGVTVRVATRADLIAMKTLSLDDATRAQDRIDISHLLKRATSTDISRAKRALREMEEHDVGKAYAKDDLVGELREHCRLYARHLQHEQSR